jgi:hypothetical protein
MNSDREDTDAFAVFCDSQDQGVTPMGLSFDKGRPARWTTFETKNDAHRAIIVEIKRCIDQFDRGDISFDEAVNSLHVQGGMYVLPVTLHADGSVSTEDEEYPVPISEC